ncbi:hypothetical protein FBR05_07590 [Deltaproteobacteria bacterium PRO3]|nr:hypothetical protein [Deltaproteobacteria bacterium PRO3]
MIPIWYRCLGLLPFFSLAWIFLSNMDTFRSAWRRLPASLTLGTAFLIGFTALSGEFTRHLATSYWLGSGAALSGIAFLTLYRRKFTSAEWKIAWDPWLTAIFFAILCITITVTRIAWRFAFHDQMWIQAHPPLVESLLRDNFPPDLMAFPGIPLKYHWGADLFGALMSYCLGLAGYQAIDVTMAFGILLWQWNIYLFCRLLGLSRAFSLVGLLWVVLGAGWGYLLQPWLQTQGGVSILWPGSQIVFGRHLSPGNLYNFFMTPYSLGMGFFFGLLSIALEGFRSKNIAAWTAFSWLLGVVSFIQVSFFPTLLCGILAAIVLEVLFRQSSWKQALLRVSLVTIISLGLAYSLGGFFTQSNNYEKGLLLFTWPPGYLSNATVGGHLPIDFKQASLWYLASMGSVLILIFPCSVYLAKDSWKKREPIMFLLLVVLLQSMLIPQFFRYKLSWDIIKWFISLQIVAQTLIVITWSKLAGRIRILGAVFIIFLLLDCIPTVRFAYTLAFATPQQAGTGYKAWWSRMITAPSPGLTQLISLLKSGSSKELLIGHYELVQALTLHSGQATAWFDQNTYMFGVKQSILDARKALTTPGKDDPPLEEWRRFGISWWIFPCKESGNWSDTAKTKLAKWIANAEVKKYMIQEGRICWEAYRSKPLNFNEK